MRHLLPLLFVLTALASLSYALEGNPSHPIFPQCAAACKQQTLSQSTTSCSATNQECLCVDETYKSAFSSCIVANCTTRELLTAKYVESRECHIPIVQRYSEVDAGTLIPFIIASILFAIRISAKCLRLGGGWGADDYTLILAYALAIVIFCLNVSMIHYGFGKNIWDIYPLDNITKAYQRFFAFVLVYKALISLAKISVCLFLLRIFQTPTFRYITYAMIAVNSAIAFSWIFVDSFHCVPVHLSWTGWQNTEEGKCIDFITATFVNGFVNIAVDVVMVIMPVYEVLKLNLSLRKKLGVAVMFAVGLILTAVGVARVIIFSFNSSSTNPTYEMEPLNHWSVIECQIAIVCACLPATRAFLANFLPGLFGHPDESGRGGQTYPIKAWRSTRDAATTHSALERGHISKKVSYSVDISERRQPSASDSWVRLVEAEREAT